ncbi:hypothetical protein QVD17_38990 [Tagetes erecta]|uniref:Dof zinc finger protein n=1 Tax=Tagetes erecta TaxID=13708 RepID=A0AAD8JPF9_TARER|nr:hypothetical protein QVD17_38990 [Tagetes erecta]
MQDIHSIGSSGGGTGGRLFGGNGGDRRLRPHHHHNNHSPQALKCPRCESLNTKFCYYNNYNLSQPRYFCKSCRRYWTKGGVLRNVPVGGGCRKTKRSKPKSSHKNPSEKKSSNSQNSSSDSSSLTANTTTAVNTTAKVTGVAPVTAAEVLSGVNPTSSGSTLLNFHENVSGSSGYFNMPNSSVANPSFDPTLFPEIGTFTNLITSSTSQLSQLPIGFNDISPFRLHHAGNIVENANANQQQWMNTDHTIVDELKVQETGELGFMDAHTVTTEFSGLPEKSSDVGLGTEDWNNNSTDQALFDLTGTVDDQSYWNQTQWDDHDHENDHHQNHQLDYLP